MYNYGYRDYIPEVARFSTLDPIRDGSNWFAYCNNEPVNFLDLWGLSASDSQAASGRSLTPEEIALYEAAGGSPVDYSKIQVVDRMPIVQEVRDAASSVGVDMSHLSDNKIQNNIDLSPAMSLPNGIVYAPNDTNGRRPYATDEQKTALRLHEVEHQAQYQNLGAQYAYKKLIEEAQMNPSNGDDNPYTTAGKGYLEYEAQQLENRVNRL